MYLERKMRSNSEYKDVIAKFLQLNGWTVKDISSAVTISSDGKGYEGYACEKDGFCVIIVQQTGTADVLGEMFKANSSGEQTFKLAITGCDSFLDITPTGKWYEQENILKNTSNKVIGVGIGTSFQEYDYMWNADKKDDDDVADECPVMYARYFTEPTDCCIISFVNPKWGKADLGYGKYQDDSKLKDEMYRQYCQHIVIAKTDVIGSASHAWVISASYNANDVPLFYESDADTYNYAERDSAGIKKVDGMGDFYINPSLTKSRFGFEINEEAKSKPVLGMANLANTFCRIDIDAAGIERDIHWASADSGSGNSYTGKILATSWKERGFSAYKVPHLGYIASQSPTDYGRNANTLNAISVSLPLALYVLRDPDKLGNFSQIGYINNIFYISLKNMASCKKYEIGYPKSGEFYQVFPIYFRSEQKGVTSKHGYDGIAIPCPSDDEVLTEKDFNDYTARII